ncbi:thiazole biosynthesis protein ThiH [Candidatus Omnitrophus magneticus]|uniref:Thiazole biosynthesis protein ThiH n=1 Tax=Candidatus Omnitrophus magneticus TaxID=1609969 RepID=A0A0F0CP39_9BACT|nr:thiazole biosynthesis protein ThiH [Candidatus Omnitrophus magneticus]
MSFLDIYNKYENFDFLDFFSKVNLNDVKNTFHKETLSSYDLVVLLSNKSDVFLEELAQKARSISLRNFGKVIFLYTPMYIADYCVNECSYCGFNARNAASRKKLSLYEIKKEAEYIHSTGINHVLVLTGESRIESPVQYIKDAVKILKKYFSSISIEIYPLEKEEYKMLIDIGVDGLTIYQEVYDKKMYDKVHISGPKKNYLFRMETPERAASVGMRTINIGILLGISDWQKEIFFLAEHARYLEDKFPSSEISVSIPRIRPQVSGFTAPYEINDKDFAKIIIILRLFLPRAGITISTRENAYLRDNLISLGITRMSAGSTTVVGGHGSSKNNSSEKTLPQFQIFDERSVDEMKNMIILKGYQPVLKDWMNL